MNENNPKTSRTGETRGRPRKAWKKPVLSCLGTMEDIVLGGGKAGSVSDNDPFATFKGGMG